MYQGSEMVGWRDGEVSEYRNGGVAEWWSSRMAE